ncbi:DUF2848 domain-containing protein [Pseudoglutamicibacter cumminsii]|uniref:DUF2848 domain-containing protein n=1 Tax=Pseudoglutamicibacter cumminsii TaxID=156979 RepID=UPI0021A5F16E|nr:DUF2848 domain-containing protein [Pseudoglutamicibacter cumminsii]MCT1686091.1 DUF2848 domain-containing protein [Pseudoglutamicibacter cumminsii]
MTTLSFELPDGSTETVNVKKLLNAGYAGRNQEDVQAHIDELAELGVPAPTTIPSLYPVSPYLAQQTEIVDVQHNKTSGEAEWAIIFTANDVLLTVACDHTDRALEEHGVAWSKNASPDVLGKKAWRLKDVEENLDAIRLEAFVTDADGNEQQIQNGTLAELLPPKYWIEKLTERGDAEEGTILISGTIPMDGEVNQFANAWRVAMTNPDTGDSIEIAYTVKPMPEPIG